MALLELPLMQAAGRGVYGAIGVKWSNSSTSFLSSNSHVDRSSNRQSSYSPSPHCWRPSPGNALMSSHQCLCGYARFVLQDGYCPPHKPDSRRNQGLYQFSFEQRSSGGGRGRRSLAELTLPKDELERLINLGIRTKHVLRMGRRGVSGRRELFTNSNIRWIHYRWRNSEVVRLEGDGPMVHYLDSTHKTLEARTGGLVVWKSAGAYVIYRGKDYVPRDLAPTVESSDEAGSREGELQSDSHRAQSLG